MALNIERTYNNLVNRQKFIHLFLIATLCFGQFAASTHIAGHVHDHHSVDDLRTTSTDSTAQAALKRIFELRRSFNQVAENAGENAGENAEYNEAADCSVYHAFSGLCGAFTSPGSVVVGWSQLGAIFPTNQNYIARATSDDKRIRAPPVLS